MENTKKPAQNAQDHKLPQKAANEQLVREKKENKFLKILLETQTIVMLLIVLVVIGAAFVVLRLLPQTPSDQPIPSAIVATSPTTLQERIESEFSQTEEFINFNETLAALEKENNDVDLTESTLTFPFLDMDVNYDQGR